MRTALLRARPALRLLLAAAFAVAGVLHLTDPEPFLAITPPWVPYPEDVIRVTGVCEILGAAGLLVPRTRRAAGALLALYAVCVFPANLHHALGGVEASGLPAGWAWHGPRLLFQPVIVWWALWASELIDWPARRVARAEPPRDTHAL